MKINKTFKPELIASTDDTRYTITAPYLEGDRVIATNGMAMVVLPIEREENDTDGHIQSEAFKTARKQLKNLSESQFVANGQITYADGSTAPRVKDMGNFPQWKQVVPPIDRPVGFKVALDAELLLKLADALGAMPDENKKNGKIVTLTFKNELSAIVVTPHTDTKAMGILMPVRLA